MDADPLPRVPRRTRTNASPHLRRCRLRRARLSEGNYSLDVSRQMNVSTECVLHGFEGIIAMRDKWCDLDLPALNEIQGAEIRRRPAIGFKPARRTDRRHKDGLAKQ